MRVAIDARTSSWSGIGRYVIGLLKSFIIRSSLELLVISNSKDDIPLNKRTQRVLSSADVFSIRGLFELSSIARRGGTDVFHAPMFVTPYDARSRLVVTIHDLIPIKMPEVMPRARDRKLYYFLNRRAIRNAEALLVPSKSTKEDVLDIFDCPEEKVYVIPHALDEVFLNSDAHEVGYIPDGLKPEDQYLLGIGSGKPNKNLVRLLEAFAKVKKELSVKLVLIGSQDQRFPEVQSAIASLGISDDVIYSGKITDPELIALYIGAFAFIFPSIYEGFGLPPLEAMACNVPVACSNVTSVPEIVKDAALLFDPYSVDSISDAIIKVASDQQLRIRLVEKGRQRIKKFTWHKTSSEVLGIYEKVMNL